MSTRPPDQLTLPVVTELEAGDDRNWLDDHPGRQFRARVAPGGLWIIRRARGNVALRTFTRSRPSRVPDTDLELGDAWYQTAFALMPVDAARASQKLQKKKGGRR